MHSLDPQPTGRSIGVLEYAVLSAVHSLKEAAYGIPIWTLVEEKRPHISIGAIYTTLERLQRKGFVSSRRGEPTAERGGRAKRYYRIEAAGVHALNAYDQGVDSIRGLRPAFESA